MARILLDRGRDGMLLHVLEVFHKRFVDPVRSARGDHHLLQGVLQLRLDVGSFLEVVNSFTRAPSRC